jgi:hypothetical protein
MPPTCITPHLMLSKLSLCIYIVRQGSAVIIHPKFFINHPPLSTQAVSRS